MALAYSENHEVSHTSGDFLSVSAYERNRGSVLEQFYAGVDVLAQQTQFFAYYRGVIVCHILCDVYSDFFKVITVISGVAPILAGNPTVPIPILT